MLCPTLLNSLQNNIVNLTKLCCSILNFFYAFFNSYLTRTCILKSIFQKMYKTDIWRKIQNYVIWFSPVEILPAENVSVSEEAFLVEKFLTMMTADTINMPLFFQDGQQKPAGKLSYWSELNWGVGEQFVAVDWQETTICFHSTKNSISIAQKYSLYHFYI